MQAGIRRCQALLFLGLLLLVSNFDSIARAQETRMPKPAPAVVTEQNPTTSANPTNTNNANSSEKRLTSQSASSNHVGAQVKMEVSHYTSSFTDNPKLDNSQLVIAELNFAHRDSIANSNAHFYTGQYVDWGGSFFAVEELSIQRVYWGEEDTITFGRHREFWSEIDQNWQLGVWEPKFNLDPLRPLPQGLTGIFVNLKTSNWDFVGFASPIFIPTMDPEIREKNGSLVSDSRWFRSPAPSGPVLGKETKLMYSIEIPDRGKLIQNPGSGMRLRWGKSDDGPWVSANAAYKPINSLALKYDANLAVTSSTTEGQVVVSPAVIYHRLTGIDAGYDVKLGKNKNKFSVSYLIDRPVSTHATNEDYTTDWVQQQPGNMDIYGAHWQSFWDLGGSDPIMFQLDYLHVDEVATQDRAADGEDRGSLFPWRLNYSQAVSAKLGVPGNIRSTRVLSQFQVLREMDQKGLLVSSEVAFYPARHWGFSVGADIIGVDNPSEQNTDIRFFNQFRANDRVYSGLIYVY